MLTKICTDLGQFYILYNWQEKLKKINKKNLKKG